MITEPISEPPTNARRTLLVGVLAGQGRPWELLLDLRVRLRGAAVAGLAADVSVAFGRRGRFGAFGSFVVVAGTGSARGNAQAGTNFVASTSTWRTIVLGRRTGGPTGARSGSMGARTAGGSTLGDRSRVERRPRKGSRPRPRRILRSWDPARPMSVATPSDSTGTFVIEAVPSMSFRWVDGLIF
jgi:hypothetical protein